MGEGVDIVEFGSYLFVEKYASPNRFVRDYLRQRRCDDHSAL